MSHSDPAALAHAFAALVGQEVEDERIDLVRATLTIAQTEYPTLDANAYCQRIEALALRVKRLVAGLGDSSECIVALNRVLFEEEGFRGNREDYYDPRNSFLNDVLDRKLGIPIALAVVYMEVAHRVGLPLVGVGMPGHFLLKHYEVDGGEILIDPFNRGGILTAKDCQRRLDDIYGGQMPLQPEFLMAVSRRQILLRMLNNLKSIYLSGRNFRKALPIADLILAIYPRSPEDVKQRALLRWSQGQNRGALADLEDYLKMSPDASDADEIRQTAASIRRMMATMN
jgi:regulator of sirC expression with transglutaminase-like and TPR domain